MSGARSKGNRRERQAVEIYERAGYLVETPNYQRYENTDYWNLFDLMATRRDQLVTFAQVKANRAVGIRSFADDCAAWFDLDRVDIAMLVCHDREGWRLLKPAIEHTYTTVVDERDYTDGEMGDYVAAYLQGVTDADD
jgi:Holliday junction resolvase